LVINQGHFLLELTVALLCVLLVMSICPIEAQEADDTGTDASKATVLETAAPQAAPKTGERPGVSLKVPKIQGAPSVTAVIKKVIGYVSQIGGIFGKTTGIRIGGTGVSAIAMLVIAKLIGNNAPSWVKGLLYLSGGTMAAGSGANIIQMIMGFLS